MGIALKRIILGVAVIALLAIGRSDAGYRPAPWTVAFSTRTSDQPSTSATSYVALAGFAASTATDGAVGMAVPPGVFSNMRCISRGAAPGSGKSWTITLRQNGVDSSITCTIADTASACGDNTHTFTVATPVGPGSPNNNNSNYFKVVPSGTPTASDIQCTILFAMSSVS